MAAEPKFGAACGTDEYTTRVELDAKSEIATWRDKTGTTTLVKGYDPTTDISIEIDGDARADVAAGVVASLPLESAAGISGGAIAVTSVKYSEQNDGKATTSVSATHYPSGEDFD